ncbi:hypothetical protein [Streptomyces sp. NPDC088348]|uniref:hypothetical protein n=1 Tax=Streptomyces sp. NPDC088348 TaxID=3365853 RepID=UPI00383021B9
MQRLTDRPRAASTVCRVEALPTPRHDVRPVADYLRGRPYFFDRMRTTAERFLPEA